MRVILKQYEVLVEMKKNDDMPTDNGFGVKIMESSLSRRCIPRRRGNNIPYRISIWVSQENSVILVCVRGNRDVKEDEGQTVERTNYNFGEANCAILPLQIVVGFSFTEAAILRPTCK